MSLSQVLGVLLILLSVITASTQIMRLIEGYRIRKHMQRRMAEEYHRLYNENMKLREVLRYRGIKIKF